LVCHGKGQNCSLSFFCSRADRKPRVVGGCLEKCPFVHYHDGEIGGVCILQGQVNPTRFHERLVSFCSALKVFLVSVSPESHEENFVQKVRALKKSFDDEYEIHLCQDSKEGCREHVGDEHGEKPLQRAASAYHIPYAATYFTLYMTSHHEIRHLKDHRLIQEKR
jgi:hypothetical protein